MRVTDETKRRMVTASDRVAVEDEGCYFDPEQAIRAVTFVERYAIPSTVGKKVVLLPWQKEWFEAQYGWRRPDGRRRFRRSTTTMAKKNGKTWMESGKVLYESLGFKRPAAVQCLSISTTEENAGQIFRELKFSIDASKKLRAVCEPLESELTLRFPSRRCTYRALSSDAGNIEGEPVLSLVVDELHAHKSDEVYNAAEFSTIANPEGTVDVITTVGIDQSRKWYSLVRYGQKILSGEVIDTALYPLIFTPDLEADIDDPRTWYAANPSLGISFTEDDFKRDLQRARHEGTASMLSFRRYRLNQMVAVESAYIDPSSWDSCRGTRPSEAELAKSPCFLGADLSQTTDPCSVAAVYCLPGDRYFVDVHAWVCEEGVRRREESNLPKYREYASRGEMTITRGTVNDLRAIRESIERRRRERNVKEITFDQYNAIEMATALTESGMTVYRQPQTHSSFNGPMKAFFRAVEEKRVIHDGNGLLRWTLGNVRIDVRPNGEQKPDRKKSTDKIDPAVALLMAFGRAVTAAAAAAEKRPSRYENAGMMIL